jgi:hypothetical protein
MLDPLKWLRLAADRRGYDIVYRGDVDPKADFPDASPEFWELQDRAEPYTATSTERLYALYDAVRHVVAAGIPGDFVECGVWRGGSSMLAALTLQRCGDTSRDLYMYDTYEGMPRPSERDVDHRGERALETWDEERRSVAEHIRCYASLEDVEQNLHSTGYPRERLKFIRGRVQDTLPQTAPEQIAILRLDTDWYDSTAHELEHLYPRLQPGGILIVDDYGHWEGVRQAVDEYFARVPRIFLGRVDYTGRIGIKAG